MKDCGSKRRFVDFNEARLAADNYHWDIAITWSPMTPYFCPRHECFHVGHSRLIPEILHQQMALDAASRFRVALTESSIGIRGEVMVN